MNTAIMIDGAFYLNRARHIWGNQTPTKAAETLEKYCKKHIECCCDREGPTTLYRIFYYDCPPAEIKTVHPITGKPFNYCKSDEAHWRLQFFNELTKRRKIALRLGNMDVKNPVWILKGRRLTQLLNNKIKVDELTEDDINLELRQKGVDMRIGLDIASTCYKKQVQQIILIAGDSDFVPASKLARREGIDFILDPMWINIKNDLFEHIDGLRSMINRPNNQGVFDGKIQYAKNKEKLAAPSPGKSRVG